MGKCLVAISSHSKEFKVTRTSARYALLVLAPAGGWGIITLKKTFKKIVFLVSFFTTMEVVVTLENDPILSGMLIR